MNLPPSSAFVRGGAPLRSRRKGFDFVADVLRQGVGHKTELINRRWQRMAENRFHFYRGSASTFYRLWYRLPLRPRAPVIWLCGDAHCENVGSYRGKNRVAYFDLTDFDEACLAPLDAELGRALTAYCAVHTARFASPFLASYRDALAAGKPQHVEMEVAKGSVANLLRKVARRKRRKFLARWTKNNRIKIKDDETFRLPRKERFEAIRIFKAWASKRKEASFFEVLDICGSLSGVGTLGLRRYLVLVKGGRLPHLIDMKEGAPSALGRLHSRLQPRWSCEAERIATVQNYTQYVPIAHLGWTRDRDQSFVLSDFQPSEDRVISLSLSERELEAFSRKWGRLLAWAHLRSASWKRGAGVDELMAFGKALDGKKQRTLIRDAARIGHAYENAYLEFLKRMPRLPRLE